MKELRTIRIYAGTLLALGFIFGNAVNAAEFNPNLIISDRELTDSTSMSLESIGRFLANKAGKLASYIDTLSGKTAAEIIHSAALLERISPKYLLVTLQKEQSLVENPSPAQKDFDWATGFGVCDACSKDDPAIQKYKGFKNQVEYAAGGTRFYIDHPEKFSWKTGGTYVIDGQPVTFTNDATRALYHYTPHLSGNRNFWNIWQRWFGKTFPNGTLLQATNEPGVWLIEYGIKRPFASKAALHSRYNAQNIIMVEKSVLDQYITGTPIKFPNYSLIRSPHGSVCLIVYDKKRCITSAEVFRDLGFNPEEIIDVEWGDYNDFIDGELITRADAYPTGALVQDQSSGGVWWVENGVKHAIWDKPIMALRFPGYKTIQSTPDKLEEYETGAPVGFPEGTLITAPGNPSVYVISDEKKRPIISAEIFENYGYDWDNIIRTTMRALELHETGEPLDQGLTSSPQPQEAL